MSLIYTLNILYETSNYQFCIFYQIKETFGILWSPPFLGIIKDRIGGIKSVILTVILILKNIFEFYKIMTNYLILIVFGCLLSI